MKAKQTERRHPDGKHRASDVTNRLVRVLKVSLNASAFIAVRMTAFQRLNIFLSGYLQSD